jgi:purine-nucleoside/S-methyl-5'-thioadenosine phosphorylase / adenosine deaminase
VLEPRAPGRPSLPPGEAGLRDGWRAAQVIEWEAPGPYRVAFSTRQGGVSAGDFRSLNIGLATEDEATSVVENRRRLAERVDADADRATMAWQRHGAVVTRARPTGFVTPGTIWEQCDGLWTDEPGQPMALVTADCLPVAVCRSHTRDGARHAHESVSIRPQEGRAGLAVLHVGWRGLLAGIVAEGCRALGDGPLAAAVGPGIGPCCYDVGEEVAQPFRDTFGADVVADGRLDLWTACERALRAAGCGDVRRLDRCTSCESELFFSHRRDRGRTGRQGVIGFVVER